MITTLFFLLLLIARSKPQSFQFDPLSDVKIKFVGTCQNNIVRFNGSTEDFLALKLTHDNYVLHPISTNNEMIQYYQHKSMDIYTWVHYNLSVGLRNKTEIAEKWANSKKTIWTLFAEHPRQNKAHCVAVTKQAVASPVQLYKEYRDMKTIEMYLLRKRHVFIHDSGIVGSKCGYFQMFDACEAKFRFIGKRWWNACKTQLKKQDITWEVALNDAGQSPLLTYDPIKTPLKGHINMDTFVDSTKEKKKTQNILSRLFFPTPKFPTDRYNEIDPSLYYTPNHYYHHDHHSLSPDNSNINGNDIDSSMVFSNVSVQAFEPGSQAHICRDVTYVQGSVSVPWYPFWQYSADPVVVITSVWDFNYHHMLFDVLPRLLPIIPYLQARPEIRIHIRRQELENAEDNDSLKQRNVALNMRSTLARLLNIDPSRFISGPYIAREVIIPRNMPCSGFLWYPHQMLELTTVLLDQANKHCSNHGATKSACAVFVQHQALDQRHIGDTTHPKKILIQQRICKELTKFDISHNRNSTGRCWTASEAESIVQMFRSKFPYSAILTISSAAQEQQQELAAQDRVRCMACEMLQYQDDIELLVGIHGAGLSNVLFLSPPVPANTPTSKQAQRPKVLLEIVELFEGRMLPVCGFYGPIAAIAGVHHLVHYYDADGRAPMRLEEAASKAKEFFQFLHLLK